MKTLITLLLVALGLGGAYWKLQHPDATVDDLKASAGTTLDRAKTGFDAFRGNGNLASSGATAAQSGDQSDNQSADLSAEQRADQQALMNGRVEGAASENGRVGGVASLVENRLAAIESNVQALDGTVVNGRLTDAERRLDASDKKLGVVSESIDALSEQIDTVSSSLGNLNDNVAASAGQSDQYTSQMTAINQRIDELTEALSEQDAEQTLTNIGTRIDSMDSQLTTLSTDSSTSLDDLSAQLAVVKDQSAALESRINTLSVGASRGDADSGDGGNLNAQIDQRLQEMESKLATANADALRVNSLTDRLNAATSQISALSASQSSNGDSETRIAALEQRLEESSEQIATLTQELSTLKGSSSDTTVEDLQAELNEQLDLLKTRIENTDDSTDISTLNQSLATTRNRIQLLESRVQDLPSDGETAQAAQDAQTELQDQIAAMETRLRELPQQTDPELLNTLNQVQAEVAELRDRNSGDVIEYKVYFGRSSTSISDEASVVLKSFIKQEQNRTTGVNIYGFTDRRGDASYNQRLALQRATAVRSFLIQNGFDYTKIKSLSGLGEDAAAVTLDDGAEDADQRTVVLVADQP